MNHTEAFRQMGQVRDEHIAARFALDYTIRQVDVDSSLIARTAEPLSPKQLRRCAGRLEITYLLRLFATFEGILRSYWASARPSPRPRRTGTEILMNRIVITCRIPPTVAEPAHEVRSYRNSIVHPQAELSQLDFGTCKSRLGYFLSYLPPQW